MVRWCVNRGNIQEFYFLPTLYLWVFIYLRTNSDLCHIKNWLFFTTEMMCLLCGTNCVFNKTILRFVFKCLNLVFCMSIGNIGFALKLHFVGSHKNTILWDVMSCSIVAIYRYFGRSIPPYRSGQQVSL